MSRPISLFEQYSKLSKSVMREASAFVQRQFRAGIGDVIRFPNRGRSVSSVALADLA